MLYNAYFCNGESKHTLLYSLFYFFIKFFLIKKEESKKIVIKINYLSFNIKMEDIN